MASSIKIDGELKDRVQVLATRQRRSAQWIMREAIAQYVEREESRESFEQEAIASWTAYRETGLHLTSQDVRDWLNTWGNESETELPECRSEL